MVPLWERWGQIELVIVLRNRQNQKNLRLDDLPARGQTGFDQTRPCQ